jgi:hypothetical protein
LGKIRLLSVMHIAAEFGLLGRAVGWTITMWLVLLIVM